MRIYKRFPNRRYAPKYLEVNHRGASSPATCHSPQNIAQHLEFMINGNAHTSIALLVSIANIKTIVHHVKHIIMLANAIGK